MDTNHPILLGIFQNFLMITSEDLNVINEYISMEFFTRHYEDLNIQFRLLSICRKFPRFDSRLNQIQGVHLKFIATLSMKFNKKHAC